LFEKTLNLTSEEAYTQLKMQIVQRKWKIISEEAPKKISVVQGSIWGTMPKTAQKEMTFTLQEDSSETKVESNSVLTPKYIALTLAGIVFSIALIVICVWMALNFQAYISTGAAGFWGWLVQAGGILNPDKAALFARLSWFLTAFLAATLVVEAIVVVRVKAKIDSLAEEIVKTLVQLK